MKRILIAPLLALPFAFLVAHATFHHCPLRPAPEEAQPVEVIVQAPPVARLSVMDLDDDALREAIAQSDSRSEITFIPAPPPARMGRTRDPGFMTLAPHEQGEPAIVSSRDAAAKDDASTAALRDAVAEVAACWKRGDVAAADALIARTANLVLWDAAKDSVRLTAQFRSSSEGARLGVTVARSAGEKPVGIVFPPGTYGVAPHAQDLALLRAAIVVLAPDETEARLELPVACASFHENAPMAGRRYDLRRYPEGSAISRLLTLLCAGDPSPEPASQLAIWITANHVTYAQVAAQRGLLTFDSFQRVGVGQASEAAELIRKAGLEPRREPFFRPSNARTPRQEEVLPELVESPL